ncbi:MAG: hypothetical protein LBM74_07335 [Oscillospiraceae bacterium]|nr:hypothetical protein [Oscillospiraceae bacterium]
MSEARNIEAKVTSNAAQPKREAIAPDLEAKPISPQQGEGTGLSAQSTADDADRPVTNEMIMAVNELYEWIRQDLEIHAKRAREAEQREE